MERVEELLRQRREEQDAAKPEGAVPSSSDGTQQPSLEGWLNDWDQQEILKKIWTERIFYRVKADDPDRRIFTKWSLMAESFVAKPTRNFGRWHARDLQIWIEE